MKPKVLAANWKMNTDLQQGMKLAADINNKVNASGVEPHARIILGVPFTHLSEIAKILDYRRFSLAAQNCAEYESGAYTGEISAEMIKSTGAHYVIIGHSERRHIFKEPYECLQNKVNVCLKNALRPIFCCGETLEDRKKNRHKKVVEEQLKASFFQVNEENLMRSIIAYEPVWAIGTGETATPEQAQEMHEWIRTLLRDHYNNSNVDDVPILYGGSVKPGNAAELFNQQDINGGLVGGASLEAESFMSILKAF